MFHSYSAGGIMLNASGQILLIGEGDDFFGFPKGRKEPGETNLDTAIREIKEEAGVLEPTLIQELGTYERHPVNKGKEDTNERKHITLFLFIAQTGPVLPNQENNTIGWFNIDDAAQRVTHQVDKDFLEKHLAIIKRLAKKYCPDFS